jgi:hypothetical protein
VSGAQEKVDILDAQNATNTIDTQARRGCVVGSDGFRGLWWLAGGSTLGGGSVSVVGSVRSVVTERTADPLFE